MNDLAVSMKSISIKQSDGYKTNLIHILSQTSPRACILILHGMAEHHKRYQAFGEYLAKEGYDVYLYDHRGHGTDTKISDLGFFGPDRGYQLVINDSLLISKYINENKRCKKFILFGHSMGSIISRNLLQQYDCFDGVILSGTTNPNKFVTSLGQATACIVTKCKGSKEKSPYLNHLLFGGKKYTRLANRTSFDWLTRSHSIVGNYIHDPFCGFICSNSFYLDLITLTALAIRKKEIAHTRKELPHLIISGLEDPVGNYGKEVKKLSRIYQKLGFKFIETKLYDDCRHELLNEINASDVYIDINQWIKKITK